MVYSPVRHFWVWARRRAWLGLRTWWCRQLAGPARCHLLATSQHTLLSHASFAFDSYYQQNGNSDIECSTLTYGHSNHHRAREIQVNATMSKCTCVFFLSNHVIRTRIRALKPLGIGPTRTLHSGYSTLAPLGNRTQHSLAQTLENFAHSSNRELCCSVFGLPSSG